jgi:hypothetical protein
VPGQVYVQQASTSRGRHQLRHQHNQTSDNLDLDQTPNVVDDLNAPSSDFNFTTDVFVSDPPETAEVRREQQQRKRQKQWRRWTDEVIPSLLRPHLRLVRKSKSLRSLPRLATSQCTCGSSSLRRLKIICVFFERMLYATLLTAQLTNLVQNYKPFKLMHVNAPQPPTNCWLVVFSRVPQLLQP